MNTENMKMNEPHNFFLKFSQRLDLSSSDKSVSFQNLFIYYTWKKIKKYNNNKLKLIAPTWNDELNCPMVIILFQDYIKYSRL